MVVDDEVPTCSRTIREAENRQQVHGDDLCDTPVDLSRLVLRRPTSDFFPYSRAKLVAIQKAGKTELPDWRHLTLELTLIDLMSNAVVTVVDKDSREVASNKEKYKHNAKSKCRTKKCLSSSSKSGNKRKAKNHKQPAKRRRLTTSIEAKSNELSMGVSVGSTEQPGVPICETSHLENNVDTKSQSPSNAVTENTASTNGANSPIWKASENKNSSKLSVTNDALEKKNASNSLILSDSSEVSAEVKGDGE